MPKQIMNNISAIYCFISPPLLGLCVGPQGPRYFFTFNNSADNRDGEISLSLIFPLKLTRAACDIFCVNKGDALPLQPSHPAQITPLLLKATRV